MQQSVVTPPCGAQAKLREREHAVKQRMLLGKAQRGSAGAQRHAAAVAGPLPRVPSAGSEEGTPHKELRRSDGALGAHKALHGSFMGAQQGGLASPRCETCMHLCALL